MPNAPSSAASVIVELGLVTEFCKEERHTGRHHRSAGVVDLGPFVLLELVTRRSKRRTPGRRIPDYRLADGAELIEHGGGVMGLENLPLLWD